MTLPHHWSITTDGNVELALYAQGPAEAPVVVLVHGYPDNHQVWDGVAALLAERFRVVRYDVRGCGNSSVPERTRDYALPRLSADLRAVLDDVSPEAAVHLVGHDWGSTQSWESVTDPTFAHRIATFTSVSGPSLDMTAHWLRAGVRTRRRAALSQVAHSYYIGLFQVPVLPELAARRGVIGRAVAASARRGVARDLAAHRVEEKDAVNGIGLYRANFAGRMTRPRPRATTIPVQVLAPLDDPHVTTALQTEAPQPWVAELVTHEIEGNHWVVEQNPALVAEHVSAFVDAHSSAAAAGS